MHNDSATCLVRSRACNAGIVPASVRTPSLVMAEHPLKLRRVRQVHVPQIVSSVSSMTAGLQYRDRTASRGCLESKAAMPGPVSLRMVCCH